MKKLSLGKQAILVLLAVVLVASLPFSSPAQTRKVTFLVNLATVPDTLPVTGTSVQIRGNVPFTWNNDTTGQLFNIGGDYWARTLDMKVGDTLKFKFVPTYSAGTGWEKTLINPDTPAVGVDGRGYIVADKDTVLPLQFWNNTYTAQWQYWRPWKESPDTMYVYFRVNVLGLLQAGETVDTVCVRGGGPGGSDLNWGKSFYLTREQVPGDGDGYTVPANSFYSGVLRFPRDSVTVGQTIEYKFLRGYDWGKNGPEEGFNRSFKVPTGKKDTTLYYSWYNNTKPIPRANPDTVYVTFTANLAKTVSAGGFSIGDTVRVTYGTFNTAAASKTKQMSRVAQAIYTVKDTIVSAYGNLLDYQYYIFKNGVETREAYYNFTYSGPTPSEAERRQVIVSASSGNKNLAVYDTSASITQARRQPVFPNSRPLARAVKVRYTVDVRPAIYTLKGGRSLNDVQGTFNLTPATVDSVLKWGVWMNGLAVGGWGNPGTTDWGLGLQGNLDKKMYDDGTNGDLVAGDSIFSRFVQCAPESIASTAGTKGKVGQVFKFGVRGGDNEGGSGGYGNNHLENIVDTDSTYTLASQFGSINPAWYNAWNFDTQKPQAPVSVPADEGIPQVYALQQNYPNPFNPSTRIEFSLPIQGNVELKVFNVLGQEVASLLNENMKPGRHTVTFDASRLATGVYLYRITAGSFVSTKKMLLLK
jgi:Secretion system C-terminal sorting domain